MNIELTIASFRICLKPEEGLILKLSERFSAFATSISGDYDLVIGIKRGNAVIPDNAQRIFQAPLLEEPISTISLEKKIFWTVFRGSDALYISFDICEPEGNPVLIMPVSGNEWHFFTGVQQTVADPLPYPVDGLVLYYLTCRKGGIMMHASGVEVNDHGWIFTGKSGTGKTTMARIFDKCGDRVIHDDRLILIRDIEGWVMYSTPVYTNDEPRKAPVDHLWIINHGRQNVSAPVSGAEAVGLVLANCVQQNWDRQATETLLSAVEMLVSETDISRLLFIPDVKIKDYLKARQEEKISSVGRLASSLLDDNRSISVTAGGYSMWPSIKPGDKVIINPSYQKPLIKGDIIALARDGGYVVHRVTDLTVKGNKMLFLTQGDASKISDRWSEESEIAGVVTGIVRDGRIKRPVSRRYPFIINRIASSVAGFIRKGISYLTNLTRQG